MITLDNCAKMYYNDNMNPGMFNMIDQLERVIGLWENKNRK